MIHHQQSSGNLVADKRAQYALLCAEANDFETAIDVLTQALELEPLWASGWFALGGYNEKSNDPEAAQTAYKQSLHLSATDFLGAGLKLAYLADKQLDTVPTAYTEALFDSYADRFDEALVTNLQYQAPQILAKLLHKHFDEHYFAKAVDLGCGTGLMAAQLRAQIEHLTGIDMSASMVAKAKEKHLYDRLVKGDLLEALPLVRDANLIMAADVFIYHANLGSVFDLVANCLSNAGLFLFSVESHTGNAPWQIRKSMRHAHSENYIETLLRDRGFELLEKQAGIIRQDNDRPVAGLFYLARKRMDEHHDAA
jgi:predicted TPR repeat methyltransferase